MVDPEIKKSFPVLGSKTASLSLCFILVCVVFECVVVSLYWAWRGKVRVVRTGIWWEGRGRRERWGGGEWWGERGHN